MEREERGAGGREIILLGQEAGRRTEYFKKAAAGAGISVRLLDWEHWEEWKGDCLSEACSPVLAGRTVKIDPPAGQSGWIGELDAWMGIYEERLRALACCRETVFLNHPLGLLAVLDKGACKKRLIQGGIPVTELLSDRIESVEELHRLMRETGARGVFVKPAWGSGAAGVTAYRRDPVRGRVVLYTCAWLEEGRLANTKKLRKVEDPAQAEELLRALLSTRCIAERWHPKADYEGKAYDLRAVFQFGRLAFLLARQSRGPITNLQLNNSPLSVEQLNLPARVTEEAAELCRAVAELYPGLSVLGIDILLERGSLRPRVIEVNGQGDLIYQDIFHENTIYLEQARKMAQEERWKEYP